MNALDRAVLSPDEARSLTDEVKQDAERLWRKLVELYEGGAHRTLGYASWGTYFESEFGQSYAHGYRLLDAGRALEIVRQSPIGDSSLNEAQARELAPLLDQPEQLRDAWAEASANGEPTAKSVRDAVERRRPVLTIPISEELLVRQQRDTLIQQLDRAVYSLESPPSTAEAEARRLLAEGDPGPFTPSRFERVIAYAEAFAKTLREAGVNG